MFMHTSPAFFLMFRYTFQYPYCFMGYLYYLSVLYTTVWLYNGWLAVNFPIVLLETSDHFLR